MKASARIVVVGAGVTGLSAALLLARGPFTVTVVDAGGRPQLPADADIDLRVSAISPGSMDILERAGGWQRLDGERICAFERMRVWDQDDEPGGAATLRFDADEFALPALGYIVENRHLQQALLAELEDRQIEALFDAPMRSLKRDGNGYAVELDDGRRLAAELVIAADGARSPIRDALGIPLTETQYAQTALVTHLRPQRSHEHTAWQRFLRSGPLGILPLADGRVSVVWSTSPQAAEAAAAMSDTALSARLTEVSDGVLGELQVAGPRGCFPLAGRHASRYVEHGVALIGDAAHTVHPLAGQGANLGIADAARLAEVVIAAAAAGEHIGDRPVLRRYERAQKGANAAMLAFLTGLNRLFAADSALLAELRRFGMAAFNVSGPIRRGALRIASGR